MADCTCTAARNRGIFVGSCGACIRRGLMRIVAFGRRRETAADPVLWVLLRRRHRHAGRHVGGAAGPHR